MTNSLLPVHTLIMNNKAINFGALVLGMILVLVSLVYFVTPANSLPRFFPGYNMALSRHHYTHGVASIVLAFLSFAYYWFQSGKKSSEQK